MQDWNLPDEFVAVENVGLDNDGPTKDFNDGMVQAVTFAYLIYRHVSCFLS